MKKNCMKRILSFAAALVMLFSLGVSAFAREAVWFNVDLPAYAYATPGQPLTLYVEAISSDGISYQWYSDGMPITNAANSPVLTAYFSYDQEVYCVATSPIGQAASSVCYVYVTGSTPSTPTPTNPPAVGLPQPVITRQPVGVTLANGQAATLSVEAALQDWSSGAQLRYQWYMSSTNNAANAAPIANAYSSTYTTSPYDGNKYYLVAVWSSDGVSTSNITYSNMVAVSYGGTEVKVTKSPTGETVNVGGSALFIAKADNAVKREWRIVSKDTTKTVPASQAALYFSGLNVSGDQTDNLALSNIPAAMDGWSVECKFTGSDGKTVYTNGAIIKVNGATPTPTPAASSYIPGANAVSSPSITSQPIGAVLSEGETVTLSVGASGADAAKGISLSYQWYRSEQNSNANGTPISGATSETYVPDTISGSRYYYVAVTASNGSDSKTTYSSPATVTYTAPISTPSPSPSPSAAPNKTTERNPGLGSMIIAPIIAIVVAAIVIGIGIFFLVRSIGKKDDEPGYARYDDRYDDDDYYDIRRVERDERRDRNGSGRKGSSRKNDRDYYSDDEFDR